MKNIAVKALRGLLFLFAAMAAMIFIPARTLHYPQAWLFLAVYFTASLAVILYLLKYNRPLLQRRMHGGPLAEEQRAQKIIMLLVPAGFAGLLIVPGLDHRFHWSAIAIGGILIGDALVMLGWLGIFFVFRENSFASSAVKLAPDQKVIATGPYALIRHPMYAAALVMLIGIPLALGSWWGLAMLGLLLPALVRRLLEEEKFLAKNLPGYAAYQKKVRYRLLPLIW